MTNDIRTTDEQTTARFDALIAEDAHGELTIEELDSVAAGISVSSLACAACPVSSFSSISN